MAKNENVLMNLYSEPLCPPFQTIKKREKGVTCWPHFVHSVHACSHRHKGKLGFCEAAANVHFEDWDLKMAAEGLLGPRVVYLLQTRLDSKGSKSKSNKGDFRK